jgi:hypothetical protein
MDEWATIHPEVQFHRQGVCGQLDPNRPNFEMARSIRSNRRRGRAWQIHKADRVDQKEAREAAMMWPRISATLTTFVPFVGSEPVRP